MASQNIARLGVVLGIDTAEFTAGVDKAIAENKKLKSAIQRETNAAAKEIIALKYAVEDYGKSLTKTEQIQREIATGRFMNATKEAKQMLLDQARAYDQVAASAQKAGKAQAGMGMLGAQGKQLTPQQLSALGYQTTDIITGLAGGQNPLLVLVQQGGQLRDQFGGVTNVFKAFASVLTPLRLALGGIGAVLGVLAYSFYQGSKELQQFNDNLILTNNYAGLTKDKLNGLSESVSTKLNVSIGNAKDAFYVLAASGKFTKESIGAVGEAVLNFAKLTGKDGKEAANELMSSFNGTAASAKDLNDKYHFLTVSQYKQIETLEMQGQKQKAIVVQADAFNQSIRNQKRDVGDLALAWENTVNWFSKYYDKLKGLADIGTNDDLIKRTKNQIETIKASIAATNGGEGNKAQRDALEVALINLKYYEGERKKIEDKAAEDNKKQAELSAYQKANGLQGQLELEKEFRKASYEAQINEAMYGADEETRIKLEAAKKVYDEILKTEDNLQKNGTYNAVLEYRNRTQKIEAILKDAEQRRAEISRQKEKELSKGQLNQQFEIENEKEKLKLYESQILMTEQQYKIGLNRLEVEHEIAKINRETALSDEAKARLIEQQRKIGAAKEEVINLSDRLEMLRNINQSVFSNMGSAIDNFVRTGKFAFKDFARSVIQDIIAIQLKAQATKILGSVFSAIPSFFGGSTSTTDYLNSGASYSSFGLQPKAAGGAVSGGAPYLVGEVGPELFVPSGSGTIIPNNQLSSVNQQPQIIYNGPYIANVSAIDTQSFSQALARNKDAVWAANQSATRSMPSSR